VRVSQVARGFVGLGSFRETFAAAELVGGIGLVFYSLENIFCVIILECNNFEWYLYRSISV
jgi:hypothetical protein